MERALCPVVVGRERELTDLEDALLQANRGQGQVVLLAGDAGMGKTRLTAELQRRAQQVGMTVLLGGCSEAELALPYLPFLEAIGNHLEGADLAALSDELGPTRDELGHLFPQLGGRSISGDQGDATQVKLRLFEGVHALLAISARATGLLLVLEDLHWADSSTRELLDYLCRRIRNSRVLVLATYRRDEMHRRHPLLPTVQGWRRSGLATVIELEPLSPERVGEMVKAMLDAQTVGPELSDFLHQRSEGNPFVIEELVKAALDRADIFRTETGWDRRPLADFRLPETVRDTILLRLDRLRPEEAEMLRTASVLGTSFDYPLLATLTGLPPTDVRAALSACVQQQLLEDVPAQPGRYRFRHALTREAIYDDLILPEREAIHGRAAAALEAQPGSSPVDIAHHLFEAREYERALPMCLKAADDAVARLADVEAGHLYERALPHLVLPLERARVLCELGEARYRAGDPNSAARYLGQGIELLDGLGEDRLAAHHRITYGVSFQQRSQPARCLAEFQRALAVLEPLGPSEDLAFVYARKAFMAMVEGDYAGSETDARRAIEVAELVGAELPKLLAMSYLGSVQTRRGMASGVALMDAASERAERLGYRWVAANIAFNTVISLPIELFGQCDGRLARLRELDRSGRYAAAATGVSLLTRGRFREALTHLEEVVRLAAEVNARTQLMQARNFSALCLAAMGRADDALRSVTPFDLEAQLQDRTTNLLAWIAVHMVGGRQAEAQEAVRSLVSMGKALSAALPTRVSLTLAAAALDAGLPEEAALVISLSNAPESDPFKILVEAELRVGQGQPAGCDLEALAANLDSHGLVSHRDRALRLHGIELAAQGSVPAAERFLHRSRQGSLDAGNMMEAGRTEAALARLGLRFESEPEPPAAATVTGERLVSVLFCDIRGYTALAQEQAPASLADRISAFQRWAQQEVQRHHGVVDKFAGDAVMATFNVSGDQVDHTLHALRAGLAIRDRAAFLGFQIGIGIATGAAVVGSLASGANLSVVGEATNLASRLQAQAGPGQLILSEEAHRRVRDSLGAQGLAGEREQFSLKGFDAPVGAYRIEPT